MDKFGILVGAIPVYEKQDVLILQRSMSEKFMPGAWGLPCGKIDFGERLEDAVLRELFEESGIHGVIERMTGYSMFMSNKGDDRLHNLQVNFLIKVREKEPIALDKSNQAYKWVPLKEYQNIGLDEFTAATIAQIF